MQTAKVMSNYESLYALIKQMREAAMNDKWEQLIELEQQCREHVANMKSADSAVQLDEPSRIRKVALIKNILAQDADIRSRTQTWMKQLHRIMLSNRQEQQLQQTYGF